jgi:hypothetical protein
VFVATSKRQGDDSINGTVAEGERHGCDDLAERLQTQGKSRAAGGDDCRIVG